MHDDAPLVDRFVIGVDVKGFSSRDTEQQGEIQSELGEMLRTAFRRAGLDFGSCDVQYTGDGAIAVLPPGVDLVRPVDRVVPELDHLLTTYNSKRLPEAQVRLRVAMHLDAVRLRAGQYSGPALIVMSRLLDGPPARRALDDVPGARLALIISEPLFVKAVKSGLSRIRPDDFDRVDVTIPAKNFDEPAYVYVPGARRPGGDGTPATARPPGPPGRPDATAPAGAGRRARGPHGGPAGDAAITTGDGSVVYHDTSINTGGGTFVGRDKRSS
jgi:hypothetical protein